MERRGLMFVLLVLLVLPMAFAVPPTFTNVEAETPGLQISFPNIEFYPLGENLTFNFHVFNSTNFFLDTNLTEVGCHIHIYNFSGGHIIDENMMFDILDGDHKYTTTKSELSLGDYSYLTNCNSSVIQEAGFVSSSFKITIDGFDDTVKDTTGSLAITIFILLTAAALFSLPFFVRFTKNEISNLIMRRCCWVIAIYLMMLNSTMLATIADQANIILTKELFRYMWLFGVAGYVMMGFTVIKTIFDTIKLYGTMIEEKRMGKGK